MLFILKQVELYLIIVCLFIVDYMFGKKILLLCFVSALFLNTADAYNDVIYLDTNAPSTKLSGLSNISKSIRLSVSRNTLHQALVQEGYFYDMISNQTVYNANVQQEILLWVSNYNTRSMLSGAVKRPLIVEFLNGGKQYSLSYVNKIDKDAFLKAIDSIKNSSIRRAGLGYDRNGNLMVDYKALGSRYKNLSAHWVREIVRQVPHLMNQSFRTQVEWLSSWVQQMEYNTNANRFRHPVTVLHEMRGDCDEKSLLLGLLIKAVDPNRHVFLMHIEDSDKGADHMMVFVQMRESEMKNQDRYITIKQAHYLPIETTANLSIGSAPPIIAKRIKEKRYQIVSL